MFVLEHEAHLSTNPQTKIEFKIIDKARQHVFQVSFKHVQLNQSPHKVRKTILTGRRKIYGTECASAPYIVVSNLCLAAILSRAIGLGQQRDGVDEPHGQILAANPVGHVRQAAGIAYRRNGRAGRCDVGEFSVQ